MPTIMLTHHKRKSYYKVRLPSYLKYCTRAWIGSSFFVLDFSAGNYLLGADVCVKIKEFLHSLVPVIIRKRTFYWIFVANSRDFLDYCLFKDPRRWKKNFFLLYSYEVGQHFKPTGSSTAILETILCLN